MVAQGSKGTRRKGPLAGLELLEANDVWNRFAEPGHQVVQPLVDVVNVERYDLQLSSSRRKTIVAERVRRELDARALYVCSDKALQQQFLDSFGYASRNWCLALF